MTQNSAFEYEEANHYYFKKALVERVISKGLEDKLIIVR